MTYEHDGEAQLGLEELEGSGPARDRVDPGSVGRSKLPQPRGHGSNQPAEDVGEEELFDGDEVAALAETGKLPRLVLGIRQDIQNIKNELHLHAPQFSVQELRELREFDPQAYVLQLRRMERQHEHDLAMGRAAVERPGKIATRGQYLALLVVLSVLALAGYAVYMHEPWLAGVLGAIDLIGLAAVFNVSNRLSTGEMDGQPGTQGLARREAAAADPMREPPGS